MGFFSHHLNAWYKRLAFIVFVPSAAATLTSAAIMAFQFNHFDFYDVLEALFRHYDYNESKYYWSFVLFREAAPLFILSGLIAFYYERSIGRLIDWIRFGNQD